MSPKSTSKTTIAAKITVVMIVPKFKAGPGLPFFADPNELNTN